MRILVVTYEFPPVGGGGGMAAWEISRALAQRGHEVHVLTAHYGDLPHQERLDDVQIIRVRSGRRSPFKAGLLAMFGYVFGGSLAGFNHVRSWRPDLIHIHFAVPSGPVGWLLSRISKAPYVLTAHLGDVPGGVPEKTGKWFRWIAPFTPPLWKDAAKVVAVSEHTRQLALKRYPVDIQVIPNAADLRQLDPGSIQTHHPVQISFAGRFMPQKNPLLLVRTLANLRDLPWQCVMLGDGPLRQDIEKEIRRLDLEQRFELTGWVKPEDVIRHFRETDILFMPSNSEGLPVVGVQALAMGLAIVASRVGGFVDLVDDQVNGLLIEPGDASGFEHALRQLLSDPTGLQRFRQESRKKAQDFDITKVASAYERIFQSIQ
jgi:glycosyltransferase involved in cell wall biosynthesis